jgi:Zn finger protein HypA/HybF involved in hydrogenase expression
MEYTMDNKYALGSTKVAQEHHEVHEKAVAKPTLECRFCGSVHLVISPTMHDHRCSDCGEWQVDVSKGYSTGRSSDY